MAGTSIGAYCALQLREAGFEAVLGPEEEERGSGDGAVEVSMHDFSPEAAVWLADYGPGECELRNAEGCFLAGKGAPGVRRSSLKRNMAVERLVYPWDLLDWQERVMRGMEGDGGFIKDGAHVMGTLRLGRDSAVLPGVVVEGCVWVGDGCRVGPNCYLRGYVSLGDGCVVGQGVELKNCIVGDGTFISHLSYAGDSIIGNDVNFGAGTVCSNFRHDGAEQRMMAGGRLVETGRNKLGAVIGDHVRLGANTVVLPGRVVSPGTWTMPGEIFR
ncbi:DapH/DapD/GlmU-related protein [Akkermansia sp.]|uniref:DapH/DapD/GlmU-related protein n=2 Tax=Akkermansia TaxID=239934 RepID=UPI0025D34F82|nr:DapH/DapD/GlmU-related protein [uncultured Akkermansia sp.]MEE0765771.1 DapH/DapD/GlmU-related protein [Akkermansia sp.]